MKFKISLSTFHDYFPIVLKADLLKNEKIKRKKSRLSHSGLLARLAKMNLHQIIATKNRAKSRKYVLVFDDIRTYIVQTKVGQNGTR